jgi:hypothetical protein
MSTATYKIPAENIDKLQGQITTLNKKVEKLRKKGHEFALVECAVDETPLIEKISYTTENGVRVNREQVYFQVTITGEEVVVAGWRFIATLQHEEGGTIIRSIPGVVEEGELAKYRDAKPICDHCGYNRKRNDTFVLRNEVTRDMKQVGSTCLEDFLGVDVHALAIMAELLASLGMIATSLGECEGGYSSASFIPLATYLPFVARSIREDGWLSRTAARERGDRERSTADLSFNMMLDHFHKPSSETRPSEVDDASAHSTLEYLAEHFDTVDEEKLNDYQHNLKVTFVGQVVNQKLAGLAASMLSYVARQIADAEEKKRNGHSEFVGTLNERTVMSLTCVYTPKGGRPGLFRDASGNKVQAWKMPSVIEEGKTYRIKCTPVKHEVYRDVKSTMVNRLAVEEEVVVLDSLAAVNL